MLTGNDLDILGSLFADERAGFRHQMGLVRRDAREFYAPSADAEAIRAEKAAILASPAGDRHLVETAEGSEAFAEFVRMVGAGDGRRRDRGNLRAWNRAVTVALEPDWTLMSPGSWRLAWASVCFPTRWSLEGKAGETLVGMHVPVPGLNEELGRKIETFFQRLVPGEGWSRANWGLSSNDRRNQHPALPYVPLSSETALERVFIRVESQHLCKLPEKGAVAFGIRIHHFPLAEVMAERPGVAAGLRERLRTMPAEVAVYKGIPEGFWKRVWVG